MPADPSVRRVFIDHLTLRVTALDRSRAFYVAALAPLRHNVEAVHHER